MLEVIDLWKSYEGQPLLCGLTFSVPAGRTVCLLGASGSGKSTLLRMIAGLEPPEQGEIRWDGQDLSTVLAHRRNFGLVFQDYALFPHLSVAQNVTFGLRMQNLPPAEIQARVADAMARVNLAGFERRRVTDLSGGEQQRVALARALAPRPRLLMFDEPLGALDRNLRERLMEELRNILHATGVPAIYVTHDQEEAFALADQVLLLHNGEIVRQGTPPEVWNDPGSAWAAQFLGVGNVLAGVVGGDGCVDTAVGRFAVECGHGHSAGEVVTLLVRPEGARLGPARGARKGSEAAAALLGGHVVDVVFDRERFKVSLSNGLYFYLSEAPQIGAEIRLDLPSAAIQCLP